MAEPREDDEKKGEEEPQHLTGDAGLGLHKPKLKPPKETDDSDVEPPIVVANSSEDIRG